MLRVQLCSHFIGGWQVGPKFMQSSDAFCVAQVSSNMYQPLPRVLRFLLINVRTRASQCTQKLQIVIPGGLTKGCVVGGAPIHEGINIFWVNACCDEDILVCLLLVHSKNTAVFLQNFYRKTVYPPICSSM